MSHSEWRGIARRLMPAAIAALVLAAPAIVMAQDSTAAKPADKAAPAKAAVAKAADAKADAKTADVKEDKAEAKSEKAEKSDADKAKWQSERFDKMTQKLKLTDEQKEKVRPIMLDEMTRARELREKYEGKPMTAETHAAMEKEHAAIRAGADAKLAQILTPDQMSELKKMRAEHMKRGGSKDKDEAKEAKEAKK